MAAHGQGEGVDGETKEPETQSLKQSAEPAQTRSEAKAEQKPARHKADLSEIRGKTFGVLAGIVRWVGLIFALVLVVHVILVIGEANPQNSITTFVKGWADFVALGFQDLFSPQDPKVRVLVNYGTAAIFWLVVSSIIATLIRRLGGEKASQ
jgi:hypothetical protein